MSQALDRLSSDICLLHATPVHTFQPQAEDILTDEDLLDLFRIIKQVLRKKSDPERLGKLLFCMYYALGDGIKTYQPLHSNHVLFRYAGSHAVNAVQLSSASSCCSRRNGTAMDNASHARQDHQQRWGDTASISSASSTSSASSLARLLSGEYLNGNDALSRRPSLPSSSDDTSTDAYTVRPYTNLRPHYRAGSLMSYSLAAKDAHPEQQNGQPQDSRSYTPIPASVTKEPPVGSNNGEYVMEPNHRGFYYQDGRIAREPALLQRYAEQGILTQASLMRKRKRHANDGSLLSDATIQPTVVKKPKIPHRHGEFEQRRDDIIGRLRSITRSDLGQKAERHPKDFTLAIDQAPPLPPLTNPAALSQEEAAELLKPALDILTQHSNMKPHLDNGMNQNGIHYNTDYFRLYLAFEQFQATFAALFPDEVVQVPDGIRGDSPDRDRDRERNANMKAYRSWIEPHLTETNWAAFRRNIVVGERMMQLTKIVGQGVLLMTKELSGSKLHLTFTNNEWDEFIQGLGSGRWDQVVDWEGTTPPAPSEGCPSTLVAELRKKFATHFWFHEDGSPVSSQEREAAWSAAGS